MKTVPFDYDKYISTVPRPKVFTKGGIEVLDFHHREDRELWKCWGKLATGSTQFCSTSPEDKGFEGWTISGKFAIEYCSIDMKAFNEGGKYDLVMSEPVSKQEKVVYKPGLRFTIYNVYHDPSRNAILLNGGYTTPGEAMECKDLVGPGHNYLGMFSLQDNPQFDQILLTNGLATIQ